MTLMVVGLVLFLGSHSLHVFADGWRGAQEARIGEKRLKGVLSLVAFLGFALVVAGFRDARLEPVVLWQPPLAAKHAASLFTLIAFVLAAAAYVPRTRIKAAIGHPLVAAVKTWAFAHLLANGTHVDVVLFGAFMAWAIVDYVSLRRRDRAAGRTYPPGPIARDAVAIAFGVAAWAAFAYWAHGWLFGVRPFG